MKNGLAVWGDEEASLNGCAAGGIQESPDAPVGIHCILEMYQCPASLLNDELYVSNAVEEAARAAGATLLRHFTHRFDPQGVTAIALLAESHLSIHTWPERKYAAVDIFTCGTSSEPEKALAYMVDRFKAHWYSSSVIQRGGKLTEMEPRIIKHEVRL